MAKEKSADKEEGKREKHSKKEKRSEKDGVHKSKKVKSEKKKAVAADEPDITITLLDALEEKKPSSVAKEADGDVAVKFKPAPLLGALVPFAHPLADEKVQKKVLKSVKKGQSKPLRIKLHTLSDCPPSLKYPLLKSHTAAKNKSLKRGVKEVVKSLRKSPAGVAAISSGSGGGGDAPLPHGIVVLAADISPMDVISHIPVLCEDHGVPYLFVPSRAELGAAGNTKRPTSVVLVGMEPGGKKKKNGEKSEKSEEEKEFEDVYKELVKVVVRASRDVRI